MMSSALLRTGHFRMLAFLRRAAAVWGLMMIAETFHGIARRLMLEPFVGDLRARRIAVFTGSVIVFAIAFVFVRWLKGDRRSDYLAAGVLWVGLTVVFEVMLGRLAMGMPWAAILADYDIIHGGLMPLGLIVMFLSPFAAAWLTDEI